VRAALHSRESFVNSSRDEMPHPLGIAGEASRLQYLHALIMGDIAQGRRYL
jgi:hypothetical protein